MSASEEEEYQPPPPTRWQRWRRRLMVIVVLLLVTTCGGEWFVSHMIASKLIELVDQKLDAKLEIGSVLYVPPYGAWAWNARLIRGSGELVRLGEIEVKLAELPLKSDAPIVISSLSIDHPTLNLAPGVFDNIAKPSASERYPQKLSEILRLHKLRMTEGRITYNGGGSASPVVWDRLSFDADLSQQSPSRYSMRFSSHAAALADANVAGSIDVDELLLEVQTLSVNARAEPDLKESPLPADAQKFVNQYRIAGGLTIDGTATIPLRDPRQGKALITIVLKDGGAVFPPDQIPLENAHGTIICQKMPGSMLKVKVDTLEATGQAIRASLDSGNAEVDGLAGTWKVTDVQGRVYLSPPGATTAPIHGLEGINPAGRVDFTAMASGPIELHGQKPLEAIRHEIIAYPRDISFHLEDFARRFEKVNGGEVRLVNGTIIFQELRARYGDDDIRVRGARLPLEGWPKVESWREISAAIIFNPPLPHYTPGLDRIMKVVNPSGAFLVAGNYTHDETGPTERRDYDLILSSDTGAVILTPRKIAVSKIRGDATLTPAGVELHGVEAEIFGGKLQADGNFKSSPAGAPDTYSGDLAVSNLDLARIQEQFSAEPPAKPMEGRGSLEATFSGAIKGDDLDSTIKALQAGGQYEVINGSLYQFPIFGRISREIPRLKSATTLGDAAAQFEIASGELRLQNVAVNSPVLGLQGSGTVNMLDGRINADVVAAPLADWKEKLNQMNIPIVGSIAADVVGGVQKMLNTATGSLLYAFRVSGTVKDMKVAAVPVPVLTDTAALVFGHMIKPLKDERPLDLLKLHHEQPQTKPSETKPAETKPQG